jgi:hypothetical protein
LERLAILYPTTAAPPPAPETAPPPPASLPAPEQQPEVAEHLSAGQSSQELKPKAKGRQVRRVEQALQELFPPDGHPPVEATQKAILKRVNEEFFKPRGWKPAKRDALARAMGLRT